MDTLRKSYFSHDHNARNDRRMAGLIKDHKGTGYGVFWAVVEMIHEEGGAICFDDLTYDAVGKDLCEESTKVKLILEDCINKYKLFILAEGYITSNRINRNLDNIADIREAKSKAGLISACKRKLEKQAIHEGITDPQRIATYVQHLLNTCLTQGHKEKKIKEKKIKENISIEIPVKVEKNAGEIKTRVKKVAQDQISPVSELMEFVCYDVEEMILKDQAFLEAQCMKASITMEVGKRELRKYHLNEEKNQRYPMGRKAALAGFEFWLIRSGEFKQSSNGRHKNSGAGNSTVAISGQDGSKP